MARYVLVEISDNAEADLLVAALRKGEVLFAKPADDVDVVWSGLGKVEVTAVWAKPTLFCECPVQGEPKSVKSKNYGWMVHDKCSKPRRGVYQHPRNLLDPPDMDIRQRMFYLGFRADPTFTWKPQDEKGR